MATLPEMAVSLALLDEGEEGKGGGVMNPSDLDVGVGVGVGDGEGVGEGSREEESTTSAALVTTIGVFLAWLAGIVALFHI